MKEHIVDISGFGKATTPDNYILWLHSPYQFDAPGRWPSSQQVHCNYYILIISLAEHYGWLV